jgi:hypothetical protein
MPNQQKAELELITKHARAAWQQDALARDLDASMPENPDVPASMMRFFEARNGQYPQNMRSEEPELDYAQEDTIIVQCAIDCVNRRLRRHQTFVKFLVVGLCILVSSVPVVAESLQFFPKLAILVSGAAIISTLLWYQLWDKKFGMEKLLQRHADRQLLRVVRDRGIHSKLRDVTVVYSKGRFYLRTD